jgi:hypothetical protein
VLPATYTLLLSTTLALFLSRLAVVFRHLPKRKVDSIF